MRRTWARIIFALIFLMAIPAITRAAYGQARLVPQSSALLAPGVVNTTYIDSQPSNVVHVVAISAHASVKIRPVLATANSRGQTLATVASLCQQAQAVACVNGDFFGSGGIPLGGEMVDGIWVHAPGTVQQQLWLDRANRFSIGRQPGGARQSLGATSYAILLPGQAIALPEHDAFSDGAHARTLVGWTRAGDKFLVTVEGGQGSHGMSLPQAADLLRRLGATTAVNEDGGSSSQMVVNGVRQEATSARAVANAWAVVR